MTTTMDMATATAMETDISNNKKAYDHCIKFVTKGLNGAKPLTHRLQDMQKEAKTMMEAGAGGIEERKLKFWMFGTWWARFCVQRYLVGVTRSWRIDLFTLDAGS
jgi:hypothetical protein